jgi:hypothetical protein
MTPGNSLPPCTQFAFISEFDETHPDCAVCGRLEITHEREGRRSLTAVAARTERLALIELTEKTLDEEGPQ